MARERQREGEHKRNSNGNSNSKDQTNSNKYTTTGSTIVCSLERERKKTYAKSKLLLNEITNIYAQIELGEASTCIWGWILYDSWVHLHTTEWKENRSVHSCRYNAILLNKEALAAREGVDRTNFTSCNFYWATTIEYSAWTVGCYN